MKRCPRCGHHEPFDLLIYAVAAVCTLILVLIVAELLYKFFVVWPAWV